MGPAIRGMQGDATGAPNLTGMPWTPPPSQARPRRGAHAVVVAGAAVGTLVVAAALYVEGRDHRGALVLPLAVLVLGCALTGAVALALRRGASRERGAIQREQGFRSIADAGPMLIWTTDAGGRWTYVSQAWGRITGRDRSGDLGWGWTEAVDPAHRGPLLDAIRHTLRTGRPLEHELRVRAAEGGHLWLLARAHRRGPDGASSGLVGAFTDITARRRAEQRAQERTRYTEALIASMQDGLAVATTDGRLVEVSDRYAALFGVPAASLVGRSVPFAHWHKAQRRAMADLYRRVLREGSAEVDLELDRPGGGRLPVIVSAAPMRDESGVVSGIVETVKDVSEREAAEAARRAAEVEQQVAREQEALRQVATAVAAENEPRRVFAQVAEQARQILGASSAAVVRFDRGERATVVGAAGGTSRSGPPLGSRLPLEGGGVAARVYRGAARPEAARGRGDDVEVAGGGVGAPVATKGRLWGAVCVFGADRPTADTMGKLARFAELVALAIASADARQQLGRLASTDHLTSLPNKRSFQERLAAEVERARRHGRELGLAVFDVDEFKRINDQHGHQVGDRILRELAARLAGVIRSGEMLARVGGEEFAWIVPETGGLGAYAAAERARSAVGQRPFAGVGTVTVSAGVCDLSQSPGGGGELFRLADVALYWAKANGRNATFRYSPETIQVLSAEQQAGQLERAQAVSAIRVLARAVDAKHPDTRRHSERVAELALKLALELGWSAERARSLRDAAMVHDVGKISVPDDILLKPGPLTDDEYTAVKRHASIGSEIVAGILNAEQVDWVRHHHERVDGRGYPDGLRGEELSEGASILAAADAWDAMTRTRSYRAAMSSGDAIAECRAASGSQFPEPVVDALERLLRSGVLAVGRGGHWSDLDPADPGGHDSSPLP